MNYTTIDLDGEPWMVCDPQSPEELQDVIEKSGFPEGSLAPRKATPREGAKLTAERILAQRNRDNPDQIFGVSL